MAQTAPTREQTQQNEKGERRRPDAGAAANRTRQRRPAPARWPREAENGRSLSQAQLARGLGWFSIGLGLAELFAPRQVTRLIGVRGDYNGLVRLLGARELASGLGILTQERRAQTGPPAPWLWARVGGDALDLALLGAACFTPKADRSRLAAATAAVAGVTALDVLCAQQISSGAGTSSGAVRVLETVTINRAPEELYRFWRDFQNLPRLMSNLETVQVLDNKRSHWVAKAPAGTTVEWDAEIIEDQPNELISWRSLPDASVDSSGSVRFERATGGRGTVVKVQLQYRPPAGVLGAGVARLFGAAPEQEIQEDLRRFKQMMEAGEIPTTEGQSSGRR